MGTLSIDAQQSQQIEKLQEDVEELTTKLNAVVADVGTIKGKVDTLITDVTSLKDKIGTATYGNTTGGGSSADPILKRLHDLDTDFVNLSVYVDNHQAGTASAKHGGGSGGQTGRGTGGPALGQSIDISGASTSSTGSVTQTASNASTTGTFNTSTTNVVTIENDSATRAREVARSTLTRLRDI